MSPADVDPFPGAPPEAPAAPVPAESGEAEAWAEVLAAWDDEARHRAYLSRFADLDGLTVAGRRYRDALAARPGDPVAARWRDEVVKRATVAGLAQLPRSPRVPSSLPRVLRWLVIGLSLLGIVKMGCALGPDAAHGVGALWPR